MSSVNSPIAVAIDLAVQKTNATEWNTEITNERDEEIVVINDICRSDHDNEVESCGRVGGRGKDRDGDNDGGEYANSSSCTSGDDQVTSAHKNSLNTNSWDEDGDGLLNSADNTNRKKRVHKMMNYKPVILDVPVRLSGSRLAARLSDRFLDPRP